MVRSLNVIYWNKQINNGSNKLYEKRKKKKKFSFSQLLGYISAVSSLYPEWGETAEIQTTQLPMKFTRFWKNIILLLEKSVIPLLYFG